MDKKQEYSSYIIFKVIFVIIIINFLATFILCNIQPSGTCSGLFIIFPGIPIAIVTCVFTLIFAIILYYSQSFINKNNKININKAVLIYTIFIDIILILLTLYFYSGLKSI